MSQPGNQVSRGGYVDVDQIDDAESGVRAVISQRRGHNKFTFALFKVFHRDGVEERTSFFEPDRHADALLRLIPKASARIVELEREREFLARPGRRI